MRTFLIRLVLLTTILAAPLMAADKFALSVDTTKAGAKLDRNLFGQFAEHLGHGVYEGIWVGPDSAIPNTRGIRNDVSRGTNSGELIHARIGPAGRAARMSQFSAEEFRLDPICRACEKK